MTTFYLVRHGTNDLVGKRIAGRIPGVHLNQEGRSQAQDVAERLGRLPITRVLSSPLERAFQTAQPLAQKLNLKVEISEALHELDFGEWNGKSLDELNTIALWKLWNHFRSGIRIPGGEILTEALARMIGLLDRLRKDLPGEHIALFSHGDPIRVVLAHFLGLPIDFLTRMEVDPGSINVVSVSDHGPKILALNWKKDLQITA